MIAILLSVLVALVIVGLAMILCHSLRASHAEDDD